MITNPYTWELDPTGTSSANLVTGERHSLSIDSGNGFHFFIPKAAPFFLTNIKIVHVATGRELMLDVDWSPGWEFTLATRRTYKPVYGAIVILDKTLNGTFEIQYQTLGGEYVYDEQTLLTYLLNVALDPRITTWEAIVDKPLYFTPIEHVFSVEDLVGPDAMVEALDRIRDAILSSIETIYPSLGVHIRNLENPHATTKAQVGLGAVENFPMASDAEAVDGLLRNRYMSPAATKVLLAQLSSETVAGHASNYNNPHHVTAVQLGLGLVSNYATATMEQALQGTAADLFMTPETTAALINKLTINDVSDHLTNYTNPHQVTKAQVGLGLVSNFAVADSTTLDAGVSNTHYVTPGGVAQMVAKLVGSAFSTHIADHLNPHAVTKTQVGLGYVSNYAVANTSEYDAGLATNKYVVVAGVKQMIDKFANQSVGVHLTDYNNPHQVSKAQVGLRLVQNYAIATQSDAETGTSDAVYMTPLKVKQAIDIFANQSAGVHVSDTSNPHQVTKTQVGLGAVENYAPATQLEAETGTSNVTYMTPLRVSEAISALALLPLTAHVTNIENPHSTNKAQVGLGNVDNYLTATQAQAEAGTATNAFMTPLRVSEAISALALLPLTAHVTNIENPHQVTKLQVGLGLVDNFATGTVDDVIAGTASNLFVTPLAVNAAIHDLVGVTLTNHTSDTGNPHSVTKAQVSLDLVENYAPATQLEAEEGVVDTAYMTPLKVKQAIVAVIGSQPAAGAEELLVLQRTVMRQSYTMASILVQTTDAVAGVTPTTLMETSLSALIPVDDDTNHTYTWSGSFTVDTGVTARLVLAGMYLWEGAHVTVTIGGVSVLDDTLLDPARFYDQVPLAEGTNDVVVTIVSPLSVVTPEFTTAFIRSESLTAV